MQRKLNTVHVQLSGYFYINDACLVHTMRLDGNVPVSEMRRRPCKGNYCTACKLHIPTKVTDTVHVQLSGYFYINNACLVHTMRLDGYVPVSGMR